MKKLFLTFFFCQQVVAASEPKVCGRYLMVGQYLCEATKCSLTVYPGSKSEMKFEMGLSSSPAVIKLTGQSVRGWFDLYHLGPPYKVSIHGNAVMDYPEEMGPNAFKLIKEEKCKQ